jgi:predicted phage replisome organizer/uncharacterized phage protein (TIGR02220 family)
MEKNKKYYWLKLDRNFFKRHDIQVIEAMDNGKDYVLFYLKLLVESIDHEGQLRFNETIPYDEKMLSIITNTNVDIVKQAIKLFVNLNLMEVFDDKTIYLTETQKMLGESTSTHRVQAFRERQKQLQIEEGNVTETLRKRKNETQLEKEIDKELEKDKEKDKELKDLNTTLVLLEKDEKGEMTPYKEIVEYLNEKTGLNLRHTTNKTRDLIKARWNEGFRLEDFKSAIDNAVKFRTKPNGEIDTRYLMPKTIFNGSFETRVLGTTYKSKSKEMEKEEQVDILKGRYDHLITKD